MTEAELELRRTIFRAFAETGAPPPAVTLDRELLEGLAAAHVVVLDGHGEIRMAHPFAGHREGTRVTQDGRTWWGNCAWDGLGIKAALKLGDAAHITSGGVVAAPGAVFHVAVPASRWWDDIAFT